MANVAGSVIGAVANVMGSSSSAFSSTGDAEWTIGESGRGVDAADMARLRPTGGVVDGVVAFEASPTENEALRRSSRVVLCNLGDGPGLAERFVISDFLRLARAVSARALALGGPFKDVEESGECGAVRLSTPWRSCENMEECRG